MAPVALKLRMLNQFAVRNDPMLDLAVMICDRTDWSRPELAPLRREGDPLASALALIRHLREREVPRLGYTRAYAREVRAAASETQIREAGARWDAALRGDMLMPYHGNAFAALGAETIILAATPARCRATAARVIENQTRWAEGYWGVVNSVVEVIRFLFPLAECADADLLSLFCWLFTKADGEWTWARTWDESTLGTSGHNWWAHTLIGFWTMGLCFPEFTGVGRFRSLAPDYVARELSLLFEDDGWSKEGSAAYHIFAVESLLHFVHLMTLNGIPLPGPAQERLHAIVAAAWLPLCPDGDYPVFADSARQAHYKGFHGQDRPEYQPGLRLRRLAARFWLPEAKYIAESLNPNWTLPYGVLPDEGENLLEAYRRVPAVAPASPDSVLSRSGLYMMRSDLTPAADYLGLIAGTLGPRVSSHKHVDIFSFELYAKGRRLLVDNWYGPVAEVRDNDDVRMWRVSTAAHNTTTVDGEDQVPIVHEFMLGATIVPTVDDWRSTATYAYFSGVHEGYLRLPNPVTGVRRKIFYLRDGYWILLDRFTAPGDAEHAYQLHFHINAPARVLDGGRVVTEGDGGNLLIVPVPGFAGTPDLRPNPWPMEGYENPNWLTYTRRTAGHDLFATLLVPFTGAIPAVDVRPLDVYCDERVLTPHEATALAITLDGRDDLYFDQHLQWNLPWQAGGVSGDGRLYHSRM
jgi:hypothetical protein